MLLKLESILLEYIKIIFEITNLYNCVYISKKNKLTLHKSGKELKSKNALKDTVFQLSLITVIYLK